MYSSWKDVPEEHKAHILPELQTYFDLSPYYQRYGNIVDRAIMALCSKTYRNRKTGFKKQWFTDRDGFNHPDEIRDFPPPNMTLEEWNRNVDYITDPKNLTTAEQNKINRSKQIYASLHGGNSYAQIRHRMRDPVSRNYTHLVDDFGRYHMKNNQYVNSEAEQAHAEMMRLRNSQEGSSSSVNDTDILSQVLGEWSGHNRGRGRKIKSLEVGSSSQQSQQGPMYTHQRMQRMQQNVGSLSRQVSEMRKMLQTHNFPLSDFVQNEENEDDDEEENEDEDEDDE